jgi:branched-chain amino acid transport system ATP-binding protein
MSGAQAVLELDGVGAGYNGVSVVRDIHLHVEAGEVVALLGPNGAGKTTVLRTISGTIPAIHGTVSVLGGPPDCRRPYRLARRGVAHVPEDRSLFPDLTVRENLRLAPDLKRRDRSGAYDHAVDLFPALAPLLNRRSGLLSGGEQQMLAMARAIIARPRVLLVDEMSLGLAPMIVEELVPVVRRVADETGAAVVVVEQHVHLALKLADRAFVLANGRVVLDGPAAELRKNPERIQASYLGD